MRELSKYECDQAGGGTISVDSEGNVIASKGVTTINGEGDVTIRTDDGWRYYSSGENWVIMNPNGEYVDCALKFWLERPNQGC